MTPLIMEKHIHSILNYWKSAVDWKNGGIFYIRDPFDKIKKDENKCLLMHVRQLYNFSVGYELKNQECEKIAKHLFNTLDPLFLKREGLYASFSKTKNKIDSKEEFSAYNQFYAVVGLSRYARAFNDKKAWYKAKDLFFHSKKSFSGKKKFRYFGVFASWNPHEKNLLWKNGNTILHLYEALINLSLSLSVFSKEEQKKELALLLKELDDTLFLITNKIYDRKRKVMLEYFEDDLSISDYQLYGSVTNAHALEWIGFMIEMELITGKTIPFLNKEGKLLLDLSFKRAESKSGGFKNHYFLKEQKSIDFIDFWSQVEAILAACYAYKRYNDKKYLSYAKKLWKFYTRYFFDTEFGGIYSEVTSEGIATDRRKGHRFKCDHHNLRMAEKILFYRLLSSDRLLPFDFETKI